MNIITRRQAMGLGITAMLCTPSSIWAATRHYADELLHEPTELAWIIAALTPIGLYDGDVINRNSSYFHSVEQWFGPFRSHPILTRLGDDFNLPRLVGNASRYKFTRQSTLRIVRNSPPLWGDAEGDLFTNHLQLIEDFALRSRARVFLARENSSILSGSIALRQIVDLGDIQRWLETEFYARPMQPRVFVSPLTAGWNWASVNDAQAKIWVPAPSPEALHDPIKKFVTIGQSFTEIDHHYVNPATAPHRVQIEILFEELDAWATPQAWEDYGTAELVFNEYLTWATFLEYARDRMPMEAFDNLRDRIITFMENRRGFIRFGFMSSVLAEIRQYNRQPIEKLLDMLLIKLRGA